MRIDIITVLPELLDGPLNNSILKRAQDKGLAEIVVHNLREFTLDKHRRVDDYPFGGEAGMVTNLWPIRSRCSTISLSCVVTIKVSTIEFASTLLHAKFQ